MCIVCNCLDGQNGTTHGNDFLHAYRVSQERMKIATDAMLRCKSATDNTDSARRYGAAHKKMTRLLREWNKIEHEREKLICALETAVEIDAALGGIEAREGQQR